MISEETVDFNVWSYAELAEMQALARGFIAGIFSVTPFGERTDIRMKFSVSDSVSIHVSNTGDETIARAFGYHVLADGAYGDEVFLCEVEAWKIEFDHIGSGYYRRNRN